MAARKKRIPPQQRRSLANARNAKMQQRVERGVWIFMFIVVITLGIAIGIAQRNGDTKSFAVEHPAAFVLISVICGVLIGFYLHMDFRKKHLRRDNEDDEDDQENRISRKARRTATRKSSIQKAQETEDPRLYPLMNTKSENSHDSGPAETQHSASS